MSKYENHPVLEEKLTRLYRPSPPDSAFANRLESLLLERANRLIKPQPSREEKPWYVPNLMALLHRPAWVAALILALVLAIFVAIIGPGRVLAEVERLFGYVPGIGFVDKSVARFLLEPIEIQREGITLRVEQVIADGEQTRVDIKVEGLPKGEIYTPETDSNSSPYLILPDGSRRLNSSTSINWSEDGQIQGSFKFVKIPAGVTQVTLIIPNLPGLFAGIAPESWEVPLTLTPMSDQSARENSWFNLPPPDKNESLQVFESYVPENASVSNNGVTLSVLQVSQTSQETGIQIRVSMEDLKWKGIVGLPVRFWDELGNHYVPARPPLGGSYEPESDAENAIVNTYRLAPLNSRARKITVFIDQILVETSDGSQLVSGPWVITWDLLESEIHLPASPGIQPTATRLPDSAAPALSSSQAADPIWKELQSLLAMGYGGFAKGPGWLHLVVESHEPSSVDPLIPTDIVAEHWALITGDGALMQEYSRLESADGITISVAVFKENRWYELTGLYTRMARPLFLDLGKSFEDRVVLGMSEGAQIQREQAHLDGETTAVFTLVQSHDPPTSFGTKGKEIVASAERAYIDPSTGRLRLREGERFFSDGTSELTFQEREVSLEWVVAPPPEVLKTIDQVIMP